MSDIRVQYVTKDVATTSTSASAAAPTDFAAVDPISTFMIPSGSRHDTAGVGRVSGSANAFWRYWLISADLNDNGDGITFARSNDAVSETARAAVQLIEYTGPAGGANEFIRRHKETLTLSSGTGSVDSSTMTGYVDINDCVPVAFGRTDRAGNAVGENALKVDIVDVSGAKKVRLTRASTGGTMVVVVYVVEFVGSNWTVQRVAHTFTASDANQDDTITSADPAKTFLLKTFQTTSGPDAATNWMYLSSSTNLRQRAETAASTSSITYIMTNTQLAVQKFGTPAGTRSWVGGSSPEIENTTCTAVTLATAAVVLQAGTDDATSSNNPCGLWGVRLSTTTNVEARRGDAVGNSDSVIHVVDFSALVAAPSITDITQLTAGSAFTITGTNLKPGGVAPTVAFGGVAQTVNSSSDTSIGCTCVRGTMKYGLNSFVLTTTQGTATSVERLFPPAGSAYIGITSLAPSGQRVTGSADIAIGDQVSWDDDTAVVLEDGSFITPGALADFDFEINDGSGWGAPATTTLITPIAAPSLVGTIPTFTFETRTDVQFDVGSYATGWATLVINTAMPSGLLPVAGVSGITGVVSGRVIPPGTTSHTVTYTNASGNVTSASFDLVFVDRPRNERYRNFVTTTPRKRRRN